MIEIIAPYTSQQQSIVLPNPVLTNTSGRDVSVNYRLSMNGTQYSYVKSSNRYNLLFTIKRITREKAIEVMEFVKIYSANFWKLIDQDNVIWKVRLMNVPFTSTMDNKGAPCGEDGEIVLQFLGEKI